MACRDHSALRRIVAELPRLSKAGEVTTEAESLVVEDTADVVSATIDRRDVPHRETPLHLAVRLHDPISAEILMSVGADWSLQNESGWSALQESEFSTSWYSWMRGGRGGLSTDDSLGRSFKDEVDPFQIPSDYTWVDANEKKRRMKAKKAKHKKNTTRKHVHKDASDRQLVDGFE